MGEYLTPQEVDTLLKLPRGKAKRLARRGLLPSIVLEDKTIRFDAGELTKHLDSKRRNAQAVKP